jgi:murein L,D-transpeptidase YcbB/YkuD
MNKTSIRFFSVFLWLFCLGCFVFSNTEVFASEKIKTVVSKQNKHAKVLYGMPSKYAQLEIQYQLLELAVANFDKRYAIQFDKLLTSAQDNKQSYSYQLMISYFMIKSFREKFYSYSWDERQNLQFVSNYVQITKDEIKEYRNMVHTPSMEVSLKVLRPRIDNYLEYRKNLVNYLNTKEEKLQPYDFVQIDKTSKGEPVVLLKKALMVQGFLSKTANLRPYYDDELEIGIKKFQKANDLTPDGIMGELSYKLLFMTNQERAILLARSIIRLNDVGFENNNNYVIVNIPEMKMQVIDNNKSIIESKVVIGRKDRMTPTLASDIKNVVLNPTWTVPETILKKDYLPILRKDRDYLNNKGISILDVNNEVVDPHKLSDSALTDQGFKSYRIVQDPGSRNALGQYKFSFPNKEAVYLHSTPSPISFARSYRALSSGCVRVEKSRELAEYLLRKTKYTPKIISNIIKSGKTKWAVVKDAVPVYLVYWTAYINKDKHVVFNADVYDKENNVKSLPDEIMNHFQKQNHGKFKIKRLALLEM